MMLVLVLTLCLAYASPSRIPNNEEVQNVDDPNVTIINGNDAERYQFPYMVSFQWKNRHLCGGSIISESWVVSAAHCFERPPPSHPIYKNVTVVAGLIVLGDNNEDVQSSPIAKIVLHPQYDNDTLNDIALIKLEWPFFFTKAVKPVALPKPNSNPFGKVWLSGWGNNFVGANKHRESTPILQSLEMIIRSNKMCDSIFSKYPNIYPDKISDTLFCTLPFKTSQSGCHGDSGGPLVKNGVLVGVVHGGNKRCGVDWKLRLPNLFTKVSLYNQFVRDHVKDLPKAKLL